MTRTRAIAVLVLLSLLLTCTAAGQAFDPERSRFEFELRTRWGQRVVGTFPRHAGEVVTLPDGRRRVRIELDARAIKVEGSTRYTELARGPRFFDVERHPVVDFVSEPYDPALARSGGALRGRLTIRGVSHTEVFKLSPAECDRPGLDFDIRGRGNVRRDTYGLDSWRFALGDWVGFGLSVRLQGAPE